MFDEAVSQGADFDRLEWQPTEARVFSDDLLRIALRHGVSTGRGIVVSGLHTVHLGRSDELRASLMASDEAQAALRASNSGRRLEHLMPGWTTESEVLDERVCESSEKVAREADEELLEVLAAPVNPTLAAHWEQLSGTLPA
jgi:hypothetical protein